VTPKAVLLTVMQQVAEWFALLVGATWLCRRFLAVMKATATLIESILLKIVRFIQDE